MKKAHLLLFTFLFISSTIFAQGTEIKVKFKQLKDVDCYLGFHYGKAKYIKDTAHVNNNGIAIFKYDKPLDGGIYLVITPSKNYFEIIVSEDYIEVEADTSDFISKMKVIQSEENKLFYDYMNFMQAEYTKKQSYNARLKTETNASKKTEYEAKISEINQKVETYRKNIIESKPHLFWSKLLYAMEEPEPRKQLDGEADSTYSRFVYNWLQFHYFDHIDFTDGRYIRTPIYEPMILRFMDRLTMRHPDSLKHAATRLIDKTMADTNLFKFTLIKLFNKYAQSKYMGMDAVYVYLAERYYLSGKAYWADSTQLTKMWERVYKLSSNLIGMTAKNLEMKDTSGVRRALSDIHSAYTLVIFWDPDCGHCKKSLPILKKYYNLIDRDSFEVYAVYIGTEMSKWRKFVKEHNYTWIDVADPANETNFRVLYDVSSTPTVYLLDKKKKIVAKRIDVKDIEGIINTLEGRPAPVPKRNKSKE